MGVPVLHPLGDGFPPVFVGVPGGEWVLGEPCHVVGVVSYSSRSPELLFAAST